MNAQPSPTLSSEERLLAALAHAGVILPIMGMVIPLIVWVTQRGKSTFVRYQSLQALAYQTSQMLLYMFLSVLASVVIAIYIFGLTFSSNDFSNSPFGVFTMQIILFGILFGGMLLFALVGLVGAVVCLTGRSFRYPILGGWLAHYLSPLDSIDVQKATQ